MAHEHFWRPELGRGSRLWYCDGCGRVTTPDQLDKEGGISRRVNPDNLLLENLTTEMVPSFDLLKEVRDHPYATQETLYRLLRGRDFDRSNLRAYLKHVVKNGFAEDRPEKHQGRVIKKHRYVVTEKGKAELTKTAPMVEQARTAFARTTYPSRASITD